MCAFLWNIASSTLVEPARTCQVLALIVASISPGCSLFQDFEIFEAFDAYLTDLKKVHLVRLYSECFSRGYSDRHTHKHSTAIIQQRSELVQENLSLRLLHGQGSFTSVSIETSPACLKTSFFLFQIYWQGNWVS